MSKINDGGPAFPQLYSTDTAKRRGMSLRAWLAGRAMEGLISNQEFLLEVDKEMHDKSTRQAVAIYAVGVADALIAELEKDTDDR